jgi:hypothetical protein
MWTTSAAFLLLGAFMQLIQSVAEWSRNSNRDLGEHSRDFWSDWSENERRLISSSVHSAEEWDQAWSAHNLRHKPERDRVVRRNNRRYWWNSAAWTAILVGAILNLAASLST